MFKDVWDAMTPQQKEGISWLAMKDERILGDCNDGDMMGLAISALCYTARNRATSYEEYVEQVVAMCQGMAKGALDGGLEFYTRSNKLS
jgi:hypothetical protein